MAYLPESDRLLVTNGDTDDVALVDCKEYKIINTLKLGKGVDHSALNPVDEYFYVENGATPDGKSHSLAIIDSKSFKIVGEIPGLSGDSNEGMVIDHAGKKLYVNLTGSDEVGVIDLNTRQIIAKWPLPDVHVAHAIALDEPHHRLFTATRKPPQFIVLQYRQRQSRGLSAVRGSEQRYVAGRRAKANLYNRERYGICFCAARCGPLRTYRRSAYRFPRQVIHLCAAAESALCRRFRQRKTGCPAGPSNF